MIRAMLVAVAFGVSGSVSADEPAKGKEVKLTGTMVCGKCSLGQTKACANVLQVKEGGKVVNYFFADKGNKEEYHENVCGDGKLPGVTVTGVVSEKDGKKTIKLTKIVLPKK